MPRVLLLAATTGYQTRAFEDAAERIGIDLVYATDRCNILDDPWRDGAIAVRFHDETKSVDAIAGAARAIHVEGVLAVGDRPVVLAATVSAELGLPWHPTSAALITRSKQRTRERLRDAGLLVPEFRVLPLTAEIPELDSSLPYPAVIKPVALSGSRGVMRVDGPEALCAAIYRLRAIVQSADVRGERNADHSLALVETFISGREYAVEGLMTHGELQVLAVFDKPDPLDGPFFEETIYCTPSTASPDVQDAIIEAIGMAAKAIGLGHGPIHAECRVNDRGVYVLEVAGRPIGGLCARSLRFRDRTSNAALISLEELLLRHSLGEPTRRWLREESAAGVMMIPIPRRGVLREVWGLEHARAVPGVFDIRITAKTDQLLVPLPEGASYLGFIFARGDTSHSVERALRSAHSRLGFAIDPEVPMLQSLHG
ncbi:MAG TPA: ATP-grasp domain-containing protein [Vicinamibacterales bacterium]|nr:ATP-grasp domain-containing protein [Vicinamibacterales bacterium]